MKNVSLLYYPGSKGWFVKTLIANLRGHGCRKLFEPFAGSAVCGLTALLEGVIDQLVLVEKNEQLSAFWDTVLGDATFPEQIRMLPIRLGGSAVERTVKGRTIQILESDDENRALVTSRIKEPDALGLLLKSRCQFGGLRLTRTDPCLAQIGKPVGGVYQGVASWWDAPRLAAMVERIQALRSQIVFLGAADAMPMLGDFPEHFLFADPPYMQANHFYEENIVNARLLFQGLSVRRTPWLLTYGYDTSIAALVEEFGCLLEQRITKVAQGRAHTNLSELIIKPAVSMKTSCPLYA